MAKTSKRGNGKLSKLLRRLKPKKTKRRKSTRHNTSPIKPRTPREKRILKLFGTDIRRTPKKQPTPLSNKNSSPPVTPNLLRLSQIGTPVNSYNRPVRQSRSPVNLSFNPEKVMSLNKMGKDLREVRCSGRLTEKKCKEDKNCKWNSTEKKCRYKPLDAPNFNN